MKFLQGRKIYSVSEVNYFAREILEQMQFWVEGEISSIRKNPNWNFYYLDIKDEKAVLSCIADGLIFNNSEQDLVGQSVLIHGNLTLYEPLGKFQLRIYSLEIIGEGYLQKKLEELIKKLRAEGLFDAKYKKILPLYPKKVCLVTSNQSDAWADFKKHSIDKFALIELYLADVRVQGPKSVSHLMKVLPKVDKMKFDVVVITRGGGSLEDLTAFNNEQVARIIFSMKTPTLVAVGHEANESLAEWVADKRASTPTDAAHILTSGYTNAIDKIDNQKIYLKSKISFIFSTNYQRLDLYDYKLQQVKNRFKLFISKLLVLDETMKHYKEFKITAALSEIYRSFEALRKNSLQLISSNKGKLAHLQKNLFLISPQNTLKRGYSMVFNQENKLITTVNSVEVGNIIKVKLADGRLTSIVESKNTND